MCPGHDYRICLANVTAILIKPYTHYGLIKTCLSHLQDTLIERALDTIIYVSLPHLYMEEGKKILTHFKVLPSFQTMVQRKFVRILAITFAVGIEPRTLGPILYHYTRWPKELYS